MRELARKLGRVAVRIVTRGSQIERGKLNSSLISEGTIPRKLARDSNFPHKDLASGCLAGEPFRR